MHLPACDNSAASAWKQGWHPQAQRLESPNFGPRPTPACIDLLVIHSISLPPGQYGGDAVQRLFTNRLDWDEHPYFQSIRGLEVSSHFYIRRDGSLWQFVSCDDRAWHAGQSPGMRVSRRTEGGPTATTTRSASNSKAWKATLLKMPNTGVWPSCAPGTNTLPPVANKTQAPASTGRT
ncbi:MAG: 1,6-anhydro-N-acetylmuramyl-L-alanine amidase AmpD [Pseudomonadota bacterium]